MKQAFLLVLLLNFSSVICQINEVQTPSEKGQFSIGLRSTGSYFTETGQNFGLGTGGQLRFRLAKKLNTEWFADWIVTNLDGYGLRYDAHIGESMMIYPFSNADKINTFTPYILGGFCGDYTKVISKIYYDIEKGQNVENAQEKWSFATQIGLGTHYNITDRFDVSLSAQYVLHFGKDLHVEYESTSNQKYLHITAEDSHGLEGHLFFSLSANYIIYDFIKKS